MSFSEAERTDIRFFCGYAMFGNTNTPMFGPRFLTSYGLLEYRVINASPSEEDLIRSMLVDLRVLRADIYAARDDLDTDRAAVWYRNKAEIAEKSNLYRLRRYELCDFLGVPFGQGVRYANRMVN